MNKQIIIDKIDQDLSDALFSQKCALEELYEERILGMTKVSLETEQKMIKARRKLKESLENKVLYGIDTLVS